MQTINNRMTETQIADLFSLAVQLQVKAEESDDRDTAILAYSIQNACSNLTESRREFWAADATINNLELKITYMAVQLANAESKCRELAAENVTLNDKMNKLATWPGIEFYSSSWEFCNLDGNDALEFMCDVKTPVTDAFLAEVRAQARNEGINYAAARLAAAFNHGFVDKPLTEVCDVVRMILDTKEELANSTLPAADGISGEYAEKFLAEFAAQLRKGAEL
ncbi:hypothetical protein [Citrobacter freundii]|uniref:hypothetical protein n=1 Tax=Citrobacter freundii TaxID=546 RepID=UPI000B675524|nr:hypothetical protein [Citrobacter freundii]OUE67936.1 hypothetical protein AZ007_001005 [Citrobacter freundii]